ncbi:MAG: sugar phosphate isomerase/epimerase family protein [Promethearchaeota archaeon]
MIYDSSFEDALDYVSGTEWNGVVPDIGVPELSPEKTTFYERMQLRQRSHELGIEWGLHAPGDDVSLFTTYLPIQQAVLDYFRDVIDFARDLCETRANIVVHAGTPPSFRQAAQVSDEFFDSRRDYYLSVLCENLSALIAHARDNANIVLENHAWTPVVVEAIDRMVPRGLKLCLDIPKLYDPRLREADWAVFKKHKDAIEVVHVHDRNDLYGHHQIVGNGSINFERSIHLLSELSHPAMYVFEVRPREAAEKSLINFGRILDSLAIEL